MTVRDWAPALNAKRLKLQDRVNARWRRHAEGKLSFRKAALEEDE